MLNITHENKFELYNGSFSSRHLNEEIEGIELYEEIYGKDKVRTLHVLLILCLNLGVDPPDLLAKISPCARMEAWYDPQEQNPCRALESIGKNLQLQYERWQPKARYRQSLDPTIEEVHRFCQSLRRSARDERVLFHYNGHGVPRPTENGEIWVFNKTFTKYIPLSLYDLQNWMSVPSVYVFDCNNAERIIKMMDFFFSKRQDTNNTPQGNTQMIMDNNIILAACKVDQDIPQNPEIPADLFTSCLTTPIRTALHWYVLRHKETFPGYLKESMLNLISGSPSNRLSMFGEINWVFTAVTDTIAWSCLTPALFQKLFRQDLLVASLFRNFLLAERILHYYGVKPVSFPALPETHKHPMWDAWDHALDGYVSQLPDILRMKEKANDGYDEENLPIVPHSCDSNNGYLNEPFVAQDDEDDSGRNKLNVDISKKLIPRSMLMDDSGKISNYGILKQDTIIQQIRKWKEPLAPRNQINVLPGYQNVGNTGDHQPHRKSSNRGVIGGGGTMATHSRQNVVGKVIGPCESSKNPLNGLVNESVPFRHSEFFNEHMTAFELWLKTADKKKPVPVQLPILLQVLLSQVHRYRALRLISEYMDLGPWAVINCLTVGIFPYVVRLLQSPVTDVKPYLVFIWGKIISSAQTDFAKNDVVKDAGYKYFVSCLTENEQFEIIIKTIAIFTLAKMLINNPAAQKLYMNQNFMTFLSEELENNPPDLETENFVRLRIWFILCFAKLWSDNNEAKWYGVRQCFHEKLFVYLKDINPEVRAATVYALGTFLNNRASDGVRSCHAIQVDQIVCQCLLNQSVSDSSPLVRTEVVVAMRYMVPLFLDQIKSAAACYDDLMTQSSTTVLDGYTGGGSSYGGLKGSTVQTATLVSPSSPLPGRHMQMSRYGSMDFQSLQRVPSVSNFMRNPKETGQTVLPIVNIYMQMYQSLLTLTNDPYPKVNKLANIILDKITESRKMEKSSGEKLSNMDNSSPKTARSPNIGFKNVVELKHSAKYPTHKHKVDTISTLVSSEMIPEKCLNDAMSEEASFIDLSEVKSDFFNWSCKYFTQPLLAHHKLVSSTKPSYSSRSRGRAPNSGGYSISTPNFGTMTSFDSMYFDCMQQQHRVLPNLKVVMEQIGTHSIGNHQLKTTSSRGLIHVEDTAMIEDISMWNNNLVQLKQEGTESWSQCLQNGSAGCTLSQIFLQKLDSRPELIKFHPFRNFLAVAERSGVSIWNWEDASRVQHIPFLNGQLHKEDSLTESLSNWTRFITSIEFINSEERGGGLLLVGTLDGKIRIWRHYLRDLGQSNEIVTAWQGLNDQIRSNRPSGLVTHWLQSENQLMMSGDVKYIRLWDSIQESKVADLPTGVDSCVTTLDRSTEGNLVFAGFGNGCIKMFDTRASSESGMQLSWSAGSGDNGWVYKIAYAEEDSSNRRLYSIGTHGSVVLWDIRTGGQPNLRPSKRPAPLLSTSSSSSTNASPTSSNVHRAQTREGLVKLQNTMNSKFSLVKGYKNQLRNINSISCADFRVSSRLPKEHLVAVGYGQDTKGISTSLIDSNVPNSTFRFYEGFSRANIETPVTCCIHPHKNLLGVGLEDSNLLVLKLQPR